MFDFSKMPTPAERKAERASRPLRVVFTGSRDWTNVPVVRSIVRRLVLAGCQRGAHGDARGFDRLVDDEARRHEGLHVERYPADWKRGGAAGIRRNLNMLRGEEPHLVVAAPGPESIGTWHCAVAAECPVMVCLLGAGIRDAITAFARDECGVDPVVDRRGAVEAWVEEQVRTQIMRSRGLLSWPDVTMPDPTKAWALLTPRTSEPMDPRAQAAIDALLA